MNFSGQFAQLLREQTGCASDYLVVKYNGRPRSGPELYQAFKNIHAGMSERRIVLRHRYEQAGRGVSVCAPRANAVFGCSRLQSDGFGETV
jgi:hypothetical protein